MGWGIAILPGLDQVPLYNLYNSNLLNANLANQAVVQTKLPVYNCPSDNGAGTLWQPGSGPATVAGNTSQWALSSYRANAGVSTNCSDYWDGQYNFANLSMILRGPIHAVDTRVGCERIAGVTDGLTNTLFVGEWGTFDTRNRGSFWAYSYAQYTMSGANAPPPAGSACVYTFGLASYSGCDGNKGTNPCKRAWGSFHTGGVHFLIGDGTVRFISANINRATFASLSTIANNEIVGEF
jgi:hypothetical protein